MILGGLGRGLAHSDLYGVFLIDSHVLSTRTLSDLKLAVISSLANQVSI